MENNTNTSRNIEEVVLLFLLSEGEKSARKTFGDTLDRVMDKLHYMIKNQEFNDLFPRQSSEIERIPNNSRSMMKVVNTGIKYHLNTRKDSGAKPSEIRKELEKDDEVKDFLRAKSYCYVSNRLFCLVKQREVIKRGNRYYAS